MKAPTLAAEACVHVRAVLDSLRRDVARMEAIIEACDALENDPGFGLRGHPQFEAELTIRRYAEALLKHYRERLLHVECALSPRPNKAR